MKKEGWPRSKKQRGGNAASKTDSEVCECVCYRGPLSQPGSLSWQRDRAAL